MNRFYKHPQHGWCVATFAPQQQGATVTVDLASGATKRVTLGQQVGVNLYLTAKDTPQAAEVGDLAAILRLFETARAHLKHPAIVLGPKDGAPGIRVSIAGARAKHPGSLTITSAERDGEEGRAWFGRVLLTGTYQPSREAVLEIAARLQAFARDPAKVAAEHGRLTGRCCFCNRPLTDERSTAVGYGETCAGHFGLVWGARPDLFGAAA